MEKQHHRTSGHGADARLIDFGLASLKTDEDATCPTKKNLQMLGRWPI